MKKSILVLSFLGLVILAFAQTPAEKEHLRTLSKGVAGDANGGQITDGTTMEEWLYATKGYADDVSKGKDPVKEGYSFTKAHSYRIKADNAMITCNFIEMKDRKGLRAVIVQVDKNGAYTYYGLPTQWPDSRVSDSFKTQLSLIDNARARLLLTAVNDYYMAKVVGK